jgi:hypothetical protein
LRRVSIRDVIRNLATRGAECEIISNHAQDSDPHVMQTILSAKPFKERRSLVRHWGIWRPSQDHVRYAESQRFHDVQRTAALARRFRADFRTLRISRPRAYPRANSRAALRAASTTTPIQKPKLYIASAAIATSTSSVIFSGFPTRAAQLNRL